MSIGLLAAVSAPTAGLVIALIALYRAKAQQKLDQATVRKLEQELHKSTANRNILLERWGDEINRYHHRLRNYLWELAKQGIIDETRVDLSKFPPPPMPIYNGDNGKK